MSKPLDVAQYNKLMPDIDKFSSPEMKQQS